MGGIGLVGRAVSGESAVGTGGEVDFLVFEPFPVEGGFGEVAGEFPGGDVGKFVVVAAGFAFVLVFHAEVAAAAFLAVEGVAAEEFTEFEEVGDAAGEFELLIELGAAAGDADILPEFLAEGIF